jgi:hypothetical protein
MIKIVVFMLSMTLSSFADEAPWKIVGQIEDKSLLEVSGLELAQDANTWAWMINDSGNGSWLVGVDAKGSKIREVKLPFKNKDWEDLSQFNWNGESWLLIADVGDNRAKRKDVELYFLREPKWGKKIEKRDVITLFVSYADGPRDVEAVAVDDKTGWVYLLSKRDPQAQLYGFPLEAIEDDKKLTLNVLATMHNISQPTSSINKGIVDKYRYQPTSMDIDSKGRRLAILTYQDAFVFDLPDDLKDLGGQKPQVVSLPDQEMLRQRESICWSRDGGFLVVVSEGKTSPIVRVSVP